MEAVRLLSVAYTRRQLQLHSLWLLLMAKDLLLAAPHKEEAQKAPNHTSADSSWHNCIMQDYLEKVLDGSRGGWITWLSSIRWCEYSKQEQVIFTTALLQAGKCPASIHIFTVRFVTLDEFGSTANNLFCCCHPFKRNIPNSKSRHRFSSGLLNLFRSTHTVQPQAVTASMACIPSSTPSQNPKQFKWQRMWQGSAGKRSQQSLKESIQSWGRLSTPLPTSIHYEQKPQALAVGPQGTGT